MYENFFGLQQRPFSTVPSADDFVGIAPLQDALDSLVHCITQARGIAIVTSAPGLGKTMLCKRLAKLLQQNHRSIFLSAAGMETRLSLLQGILFELNMGYMGLTDQEARLKLLQAARDAYPQHRSFLLILDEAHLLSPRLFEELRALAEYAPDGEILIQVVLCGSFELEEKLADPAMTSFNQRVGLQICLTPLSLNDSARFISDRLKVCGAANILSVIDEEALELICRASDGNLRCLAQLTDHACLLAFADECRPINRQIVRTALETMKELPLRWSEVPGEAATHGIGDIGDGDIGDVDLLPVDNGIDPQDDPNDRPAMLQRPRSISPLEQETDEFLIPEFLRLDDGSITSSHDMLEVGSEDQPMVSDAICEQRENSETAEFAVFEVGAGMDDEIPAHPAFTEENAGPQLWVADQAQILEFPQSAASDLSGATTGINSGMTETPVIDRYTLLDRLFELPEERRSSIDLSCLDRVTEQQPTVSLPMDRGIGASPSTSVPISISEDDVLELVQQIRRDVQDQVSPGAHLGHTVPGPHQKIFAAETLPPAFSTTADITEETVERQHAEQVCDNELQEAGQAGESPEPTGSQRRFEQLFTRLRLRRRKVEAERESK